MTSASRVDIGTITVACALGYLDFRFADARLAHGPTRQLAAWFEGFAAPPVDGADGTAALSVGSGHVQLCRTWHRRDAASARAASRRAADHPGRRRSGSPWRCTA